MTMNVTQLPVSALLIYNGNERACIYTVNNSKNNSEAHTEQGCVQEPEQRAKNIYEFTLKIE